MCPNEGVSMLETLQCRPVELFGSMERIICGGRCSAGARQVPGRSLKGNGCYVEHGGDVGGLFLSA